MPLVCVMRPAIEPISLAEARLHLKETLVDPATDLKIQLAIQSARELCENDCRRAFITQQWKLVFDEFPRPSMNFGSANWYGPQWGTTPGPLQCLRPNHTSGYEIFLPCPPLQTVDSITYIDQNGAPQTLDVATQVLIDNVSEPARLMCAYATSWPATQRQVNAVTILFTCGYGDTADLVPASARAWMLTQLGAQYEMRQAEMAAYRETPIIPQYVDRLLDPLRIRVY